MLRIHADRAEHEANGDNYSKDTQSTRKALERRRMACGESGSQSTRQTPCATFTRLVSRQPTRCPRHIDVEDGPLQSAALPSKLRLRGCRMSGEVSAKFLRYSERETIPSQNGITLRDIAGSEAVRKHARRHSHDRMNEQVVSDRSEAGRVLGLSTTAFTLLFAVWLMLGVLAVPIKTELGLSGLQFTWLTAIAVLSGSLFRLPFGVLTDRWGGKRLMLALLVWTAAPCYLMSQVHTFEAAMLLAFLFGVAGNSFSVGIAWNAAWFRREQQGAALGTFGAGNVGASVTKLFGPKLMLLVPATGALGGLLPGGWRAIPVLYSVLLLAMAAAVLMFAPAVDRVPGKGRPMAESLVPLRQVRVWRLGLYYVVVFGAYVALSMWLPAYYARVYQVPLTTAALLTAFFIFPASLLRPLGGYLSDKVGGRLVTYSVFVGMTLTSLVLCLPARVLPLGAFFTGTLLLGVGMGIGKASVYKYVPEYYPKDVGLVGGLVGTLGALGGFFLPLGFGYGEAFTGRPEVCFYLLSAVTIVSLVWLHVVIRSLNRASPLALAE